ncbi:hypothetical protein [Natrinema sp. HArc-T2]|uniref:hypothetical protein n=1 Tax=Natrinema sp. HArc-T2 TaxID=3242701 RepID=UPI00359E90D5
MRSPRLLVGLVLTVGLLTAGVLAGTTVVDPDDDGEPVVVELRDGTAPFDADTDDDGLADGAETRHGTDPTVADTDGDGLNDGDEVDRGTDPLEADTDGDGLDDAMEVHEHGTDPLTADSDGDGIADRVELETYGTNPTDPDTDGDGLTDGAEVHEHGTDPSAADTDDDGLDDGPEVHEHGTDPTVADTDGDGLSDGAEVHRQDLFPDADPLSTDVYVEVDRMERVAFERAELERLVTEFDDAPLTNPDGSSGINLHVVSSETIPWEPSTDVGDLSVYRSRYFDRAGQGYHYLVIVEDVAGDTMHGNVIGKAGLGTMMVESQPGRDHTGTTVMHELGHSLGLSNADFEGIDSTRYSFRRYPSVMNYNAPRDYYGFSSGTGYDDWEFLENHMVTPATSFVTVDG